MPQLYDNNPVIGHLPLISQETKLLADSGVPFAQVTNSDHNGQRQVTTYWHQRGLREKPLFCEYSLCLGHILSKASYFRFFERKREREGE